MSNLIVDVNNGMNAIVQSTTPLFTDKQQGNKASSCMNCIARSVMFVQGAGVTNGYIGKAVSAASNLAGFGPAASLVVGTVISPLITAKVLPPIAQGAGNLLQKGVDRILSTTPGDNVPAVNPRTGQPLLALEAPKEGPNAVRAEPDSPSFGIIGNCTKAAALVLGSGPMCAATSHLIGATLGIVLAPQAATIAGAVMAPIAVSKVIPYVASSAALLTEHVVDKTASLAKSAASKVLVCADRTICDTASKAANCAGRVLRYAANKTVDFACGVVNGVYSIFSKAPQGVGEAEEIEMNEIPAEI